MDSRIKTLSGSEINPFCFGTMKWGGKANRALSHSPYQMCRDAGINHFVTGHADCEGRSKKFLGAFCEKDREALLIACKVGYFAGASKSNILEHFNQCQTRLKMKVINVLYLHRLDPVRSLHEKLETFAELKQSGKIRYVGISKFSAWQGMDTDYIARFFGLNIDFFQPMYNLVKHQAEVEILPMCEANEINLATYSTLGGSVLTGKYWRGERGRLVENSRYEPSFMRDSAKKLCNLADMLRIDPATLAIAWVPAHPTRPMPIISASGVDQLVPSIEAMTYSMSEDLYYQICNLCPKPQPSTDRIDEA